MELSRILIYPNTSIIDTLKVIDDTAVEIALVVDENKHLIGTVTDGDIRRGLIKGSSLNEPINSLMNPSPITAGLNTTDDELLFMMTNRSIKHMPIVDSEKHVLRLVLLKDLIAGKKRPNFAVIMAGGLGSRLGSLTQNTPKPLLPVGGKPVIAIIAEQLKKHGIENIYISINYKGSQIKEWFENHPINGAQISYLEEKEFLGTAGSLSLLPTKTSETIIVINGDIISPINFGSLLEFHQQNHNSLTLCTREFSFQVPYGVLKLNGSQLISIEEKPSQNIFINAGIYAVSPEILQYIPENTRYDMPQLINTAIKNGKTVGCYPVSDYWLDIGTPQDYIKAGQEFKDFEN
ncbi:MAG: nucleotidyltransferase family protein [Candidatus Riflebacteria bacterium]|nr:nucleotidyltransferase family protein [Candidatus Riflebacteria bacterium]